MDRPSSPAVDLDIGSARDSARLAAAVRAVQHEIDALLTVYATRLEVRDAYVLGRAVEGLALTARMNPPAAVLESGLRRLVRSIPPGFMNGSLERALQEAIALCLDPMPAAAAPAAAATAHWSATRARSVTAVLGCTLAFALAGAAVMFA